MPRHAGVLVALGAAALSAAAVAAIHGQTYRAQADLVVVQVAVYDSHSAPVEGLTQQDFRIFEDRREQAIQFFVSEDRPVAVGLAVDNSTSMVPRRDDVIAAAQAFAESSHPDDAMFIVNFNERVSFGLPDGMAFSSDREILRDALNRIEARGQTALFDGIAAGLRRLNESTLDQKILVVVSDGKDNRSRLDSREVLQMAERSKASIYAVGIFDDEDEAEPGLLRRLADSTGGAAFFPRTLKAVRGTLEQIARDIRHRYTIGYVPTNKVQDGSFRRITVTVRDHVTRRELKSRVRTGYVAPLPTSATQDNESN